jgi:hypothetical protein
MLQHDWIDRSCFSRLLILSTACVVEYCRDSKELLSSLREAFGISFLRIRIQRLMHFRFLYGSKNIFYRYERIYCKTGNIDQFSYWKFWKFLKAKLTRLFKCRLIWASHFANTIFILPQKDIPSSQTEKKKWRKANKNVIFFKSGSIITHIDN